MALAILHENVLSNKCTVKMNNQSNNKYQT